MSVTFIQLFQMEDQMWPLPEFVLISFPMKLLFSESLVLTVPHKSHIMQ